MPRRITSQSSLDHLKREAKRWLRALRANDAEARARLERALPNAPADPTLRDVQLALAREFGLAGWSELKQHIEDTRHDAQTHAERVRWFVENACPDHHIRGPRSHARALSTGKRLLEHFPEIAGDSLYTAVVCGDIGAVERTIAGRPTAANEKGGPKNWEPLLYLCFTRLALPAPNDNAVAMARLLLENGADPTAFFMAGDSRYTPLVGVCGEGEEDRPPHPHRDELARLLLERGANPYDIQVVYNLYFHGQVLWFLEMIYEESVKRGRKADWDDPSWSMLDMGGYGNGARWHLEMAVKNSDLALLEWCLSHGADPNAPPRRHKKFPRYSLHELALRRGASEIAELLVRYGATPSGYVPDAQERFFAAAMRFDREQARALIEAHPELRRDATAIFEAARNDRADIIDMLVELGVSPNVEDDTKQRALHMAAYQNALAAAQRLIDLGAEIDPVESNWQNTPLSAAGYSHHPEMIALLSRYSRDIWELTYAGKAERLRQVLSEYPERAKVVYDGMTPLMWLTPDDEARAIECARVFIEYGADLSIVDKEGHTAADRAVRLAMFELAEFLSRSSRGQSR